MTTLWTDRPTHPSGATHQITDHPRRGPADREALLQLALLTVTGLHLGAGLYEASVVIPLWARVPAPDQVGPALRRSGHLRSGRVFWPCTGVPILVLGPANLLAAARSQAPGRRRWLAFSLATVAGCAATLGFFVPTLRTLSDASDLPEPRVRILVRRWVRLDRLRLTVGIGAWLAGLTALTRRATP